MAGGFLCDGLTFAQIKPTKINLSLFGRWWFQLNGGGLAAAFRVHNLGRQTRLGACMIDSKGNVRLEGMFNRAHLAPEAQRAYDTLLECVLNGQKGCEVSACAGMDTIKALVELLRCDCPELIHLLGGVRYCRHGEKVLLVPNYAKGYLQSVTRLYTNLARMERAAAAILQAAPAGASAFDRVLTICASSPRGSTTSVLPWATGILATSLWARGAA